MARTKEEMRAQAAKMREVRMKNIEERRAAGLMAPSQRPIELPPEPLDDPRDLFSLTEHTWLGEPKKSLYIPSWYKPHKTNVHVTQDRKRLGFKIADVLPHRRWAVRPDGELLDQRDFEPLHVRYQSEIAPAGVDPATIIPRVERYVNAMHDPRGGPGYVAIGFDPNVEAPKQDDGMRYDPSKDLIFSIKETVERSVRGERIEALAEMMMAGEINGETFEREMRKLSPKVVFEEPPPVPQPDPPSETQEEEAPPAL